MKYKEISVFDVEIALKHGNMKVLSVKNGEIILESIFSDKRKFQAHLSENQIRILENYLPVHENCIIL